MDNFPYGATTVSIIFTKKGYLIEVHYIIFYFISNEKIVAPYGKLSDKLITKLKLEMNNHVNNDNNSRPSNWGAVFEILTFSVIFCHN